MGGELLTGIDAFGLDLGHTLMRYDGVPMNWQKQYPEAMAAVLRSLGLQASQEQMNLACERLAEYNTRLHPREAETDAGTILKDVLSFAGALDERKIETAIDAFFAYFHRSYSVYPDALPFLSRLKAAGIPCGVLTDVPYGMPKRWVERDMEPFQGLVNIALSSVDVGFRKPNAAGCRMLAERLCADLRRMAYVGDEEKDIAGAKSAGMKAILIDREGGKPFFGEDLKIAGLDGIIL